jgi:excinuclease ABC subunit C
LKKVLNHPIQPILKTLPTLPGCYIYKDIEGTILYVGKAKNLRKRVTSYFQNYAKLTARIQIMIDNADDVEYHTVDSEVEALILEANLIKKYRPKYNVMMKDDKSYSWIKITKDPYPIIYRTRNTSDKNGVYFGPFPDSHARDQVLEFLRREFPYRTCSYALNREELDLRKERRQDGEIIRNRLCTYYHIGRCGGPCEDLVSHDDYMDNIENIKKFLQNRKRVLIKELEEKMKYFAKGMEFEKAGRIKQQIDELNYVSQKLMIGHGDDEDDVTRLSYQRAQKGQELLIKTLKVADLRAMPKVERADYMDNFRIECYDISNISGTNPVGSMVVFEGGIAKKAHYRKFKINVKESPDDFAMMNEMLSRRFKYIIPKYAKDLPKDESFNSIPDLIIIDGGKGQLNTAVEALQNLKINVIPNPYKECVPYEVIGEEARYLDLHIGGLAKRREEIFRPGEKDSYLFDDKKEALFLLQRVRDETHRFGITYHRLRRGKAMFK